MEIRAERSAHENAVDSSRGGGVRCGADRRAVRIDPSDVTKLMWDRAEAHGLAKPPGSVDPPSPELRRWGASGWTGCDQYLAWEVDVPQAGRYSVSILYLCDADSAGSEFEVAAGESRVAGVVRATGNAWHKPGWDRPELPGTLNLGFAGFSSRVPSGPSGA